MSSHRWYLDRDGQIAGPYSIEELRYLRDRGMLTARDELRDGPAGSPLSAGSLADLFPEKSPATANDATERPADAQGNHAGSAPRRSAQPAAAPAPPPHLPGARRPQSGSYGVLPGVATAAGVILVTALILWLVWFLHLRFTGAGAGASGSGTVNTANPPRTDAADSSLPAAVHSAAIAPADDTPAGQPSPSGTATFFGVSGKGSRIVYIVDCSGSMAGEPLDKARAELLASLYRLGSKQEFFVFFFNDASFPLTMPGGPGRKLLPATRANVLHAQQWADQFSGSGGTDPGQSLLDALALEPEVVFLLSDGEFSFRTVTEVTRQNRSQITINTIGFLNRSGERQLKAIARNNGGEYRFVP